MTRTSHSRDLQGNNGGRAAMAIRDFGWADTDVGPSDGWSESLRNGVELLLEAGEPRAMAWGPRHTVFLNDPWISEIGSADALGQEAAALTDFPWPGVCDALQRAMQEGAAGSVDLPGQSAFRFLPLFDEHGATAGVVIRALPVPGSRRDWLRSILEHDEVGVLDWDPAANVVNWSRGLDPILGTPRSEPRPRLDDVAARTLPEDREGLSTAFAGARDIQDPVELAVRVSTPDGATRRWNLRIRSMSDAGGSRIRVIGVVRDGTELDQVNRELRVMRGELQHRVRNILAITRSLMRRTARRANSIDSFVSHFGGRIGALARLQGMLLHEPDAGADFEMLLREELLSVAAEDKRFSLDGPGVVLPQRVSQTVSLMLHELATNALKFGALAEPDARLQVAWRSDGANLDFTWRETGVPIVAAPSSKGAGLEMLERVLPYETGGHADYGFEPDGFVCSVHVPL